MGKLFHVGERAVLRGDDTRPDVEVEVERQTGPDRYLVRRADGGATFQSAHELAPLAHEKPAKKQAAKKQAAADTATGDAAPPQEAEEPSADGDAAPPQEAEEPSADGDAAPPQG